MKKYTRKRAVIGVDLQNCFGPRGALAVPRSLEIFPYVNEVTPDYEIFVTTKDWHGPKNSSFASVLGVPVFTEVVLANGRRQKAWPDHGIAGTPGAEFLPELDVRAITAIIHKGMDDDADSYSGFTNSNGKDTGLAGLLRGYGVEEIDLVGLATDWCVRATGIDGLNLGFKVRVLSKGCRGLADEDQSLKRMAAEGMIIV